MNGTVPLWANQWKIFHLTSICNISTPPWTNQRYLRCIVPPKFHHSHIRGVRAIANITD